jgi:hypothetical protein
MEKTHNLFPSTTTARHSHLISSKGGEQMFKRILFIWFLLVVPGILFASPGGPDRDQHPYVGMLVFDPGDGQIQPYGHITLISSTEAIISNHLGARGEDITFTLDNPVILPANLHTGTVRLGGFDFDDFAVDVAIVDLHAPVELPCYAQLPSGPISHGPGVILDYVTYIGLNRAALFGQGLPPDKLQNEPAHVNFDRNVMRTPTVRGRPSLISDPAKQIATANVASFGNSGSPVFLKGTNIIAGVLSMGGYRCLGGGDSIFTRTDSELALGILTGTVPIPPPPPPPITFPPFIQGSGTSGSTSFSATIVAGAEYSASVIGLAPAIESAGSVEEGSYAIFPVSLTQGFRFFIAELYNDFTSGNDDLDLYLVWQIDGSPETLFVSCGLTSDEIVAFPDIILAWYAVCYGLDDPYNFEIWVHGYDTEYPTSEFTLFSLELENVDEGNMTVGTVTAGPTDPVVEIDVDWSGLDPAENKYFGIIDHFIDGFPEPDKSTLIQIHIAP